MIVDYLPYAETLIEEVVACHDLKLAKHDKSAMGEWYANFENTEFIVVVSQDRGGLTCIELGSKIRIRPGAHIRGPWSMSHLKGYIDGNKDHYRFTNIEEEVKWFTKHHRQLFDSSFLNADNLNQWAVKASRRLFGQD